MQQATERYLTVSLERQEIHCVSKKRQWRCTL